MKIKHLVLLDNSGIYVDGKDLRVYHETAQLFREKLARVKQEERKMKLLYGTGNPAKLADANGFCKFFERLELFDIVDENGEPTGETVERTLAHSRGIRHRSAHVWLLRKRQGRVEILLQKRSRNKDSFPGCYDISSAGHIPAGEDYISSALRELKEELGEEAAPEELHFCGIRHIRYEANFYGKPFRDNQVSKVYVLWRDKEPEEFTLQREEVEEVRWFDFYKCMELVKENGIPNCIMMEELEMIRRTLAELENFI